MIGGTLADVHLLAELINSQDLRTYRAGVRVTERDQLSSPEALRTWMISHHEIQPGDVVDEPAWRLALRFRDDLRRVVGSEDPGATVDEPSLRFTVRVDAGDGPVLRALDDGVAGALGRMLAVAVSAGIDGTWTRLKICRAEDCRRAFVDGSKNRSARWCSAESCGNRVRTRTYRRRSGGSEPVASSATTSPRRQPGTIRMRENVFRQEGESWRIEYAGRRFQLRDSKGLGYLARLLAEPGREWHVLDLVAVRMGATPQVGSVTAQDLPSQRGGDAGPVLDAAAKRAYRNRIVDLREAIEEARSWGDAERAALAEEELDAIARELSHAMGLGGRDRRAISEAERARVNVTRTVKAARLRIDEFSPELGHHLAGTVRTGAFCSYAPDPRLPVVWRF